MLPAGLDIDLAVIPDRPGKPDRANRLLFGATVRTCDAAYGDSNIGAAQVE